MQEVLGSTKADAERAVETVIEIYPRGTQERATKSRSQGSASSSRRHARLARGAIPRTGETIRIAATRTAKFRPAKALRCRKVSTAQARLNRFSVQKPAAPCAAGFCYHASMNYFQGNAKHPRHISVGAVMRNHEGLIRVHHFPKDVAHGFWKGIGITDFYILMRESLEPNETLEHALVRGLQEEFNAVATLDDYLGAIVATAYQATDEHSRAPFQKTTLYFLCTYQQDFGERRDLSRCRRQKHTGVEKRRGINSADARASKKVRSRRHRRVRNS